MTPTLTDRVGVVVIGRNEGPRLRRCLQSLGDRFRHVVYVDSASSDSSPAVAGQFGADVVLLTAETTLTAARAREAGWRRLREAAPDIPYVKFLDGDCELDPTWVDGALAFLETTSDCAVVCGRRRELHPDISLYHRLIDLEWNTPVGEAEACGGDALLRIAALAAVGGFDPAVLAGEEHELCFRLRRGGWRIHRLDAEMTRHDAAIHSLRQWWRREARTGYGAWSVWRKCGADHRAPFYGLLRSSWLWGLGWLVATLLLVLVGAGICGPLGAAAGLGGGLVLWCLQALRIARGLHRRGLSPGDALRCGWLVLSGKWPQLWGQFRAIPTRHRDAGAEFQYKTSEQPS